MEHSDINSRLEKLEQSNSRLEKANKKMKAALGVVLLAMVLICTIAAQPQETFYPSLKTRNLEITDTNGKTRAVITTDENGEACISMLNSKDQPSIQLLTSPTEPELRMMYADGKASCLLSGAEDGGALCLFGKDQANSTILNVDKDGSGLSYLTKDAMVTYLAYSNEDNASSCMLADQKKENNLILSAKGTTGTTSLLMNNEKDELGSLVLGLKHGESALINMNAPGKDADTHPGVMLVTSKDDGSLIAISDANDQTRWSAAFDADKPTMETFDAAGKQVWSIDK